jgi:hypothetical protein
MTTPPIYLVGGDIMGNWNMTVTGVGAHHNYKRDAAGKLVTDGNGGYERTIDYDADVLFSEFVAKLRAAGHQIQHASFTHGARETIHGPQDGQV